MIDLIERLIRALLKIPAESWVALSFVPIAFLFVLALWRADRSERSTFKLIHFVTNDVGRGSFYALGYVMLLTVCAWGVWALVVLNRLTEWYLTLVIGAFVFGAVAGTVSRLMARMKGAAELNPAAGDADSPAPAALERTTQTTETVRVPGRP